MKKLIAISLLPNYEKDDLLLVLRLLFSPWSWQKGTIVHGLENRMASYLGMRKAISFISGRTALWASLKALGVKNGDEVLLQAFTCVVVADAIMALGAKPVWVDIIDSTFNMDLADLEKKISPKTKVVIVQHTFGQVAEVEKICRVAKKHQLKVIEDCAQSLGAELNGRKLGSFGDIAVFSFGRDKIISSVFGGMAITSDPKLLASLIKLQTNIPYPSKRWILRQLLHPIIFSVIVSTYYWLSLGKILHRLVDTFGLLSRAVTKEEKSGQFPKYLKAKMPECLAILALNQFNKLNRFNKKRMEIANFYNCHLILKGVRRPKIVENCLPVFLRYTLKHKNPKELITFAKSQGIILGDWYRPVISPTGTNQNKVFYRPGSCPVAESASAQVVNLPTYPKMNLEDAKKIVEAINEFNN